MKVRKTLLVLSALCCLFLVACREKTEELIFDYDELKITPSTTKALIEGDYTSSTDINRISVVYGEDPKLLDAFIKNTGIESNRFSVTLTDLKVNTTYYYCIEFANEIESIRTSISSFATLVYSEQSGEINGYAYVDLGLPSGLKWATCNVGATSPTDYGDYFAWGEIIPKDVYDWGTYQHWNDTNGDGDWNSILDEFTINSDISSNTQYDAAIANWGKGWRMPTEDEVQELVDYCDLQQTKVNEVEGFVVIGPNGSCIFFPAAGCHYESSFLDAGVSGLYWSSTPDSVYFYFDGSAYAFHFNNDRKYVDDRPCFWGLSVRPVSD